MGRIENIAKFAQTRNETQAHKEAAKVQRMEQYKQQIRSLKPRIAELLEVGNACLEHNIPLEGRRWGGHEGYDTHQFITNSWSHLLGFVWKYEKGTRRPQPFTKLGIMGGGACNFNLETDGETIDVSGGDILYVLKRFVDEFDRFEDEFYKYVDRITTN